MGIDTSNDFVGTQATNMKNQTRNGKDALKVESNTFDEDYETLNLAIDENNIIDKRVILES